MNVSQIEGTILFIAAFMELILVFVLWFKGKSKATFHFGLAAFFSAIYCFVYGSIYFFEYHKLLWAKTLAVGALIIPAYLTFTYYFTGRTKYIKLKSFLWYLPAIVIILLALTTPYFIVAISPEYPYEGTHGSILNPLASLYAFIGSAIILFCLLKEYFKSKEFRKWQLKYFIIGVGIHAGGGILFAGIIPLLYPVRFHYVDLSAVVSVPAVTLITYAIFKKQILGIRVILTEILVGIIGVILLFQALLAGTLPAKILGFITFFSFLLVGYLLIRVTQKEIQRKEQAESLTKQLEHLNETLEDKVKQRTQELEKSYQEVKKRKDELERFYNLTVGRELKMVELKKQIRELKEKIGEK